MSKFGRVIIGNVEYIKVVIIFNKEVYTLDTFPLDRDNLYLFHEGTHLGLYQLLGAHFDTIKGEKGVRFTVWAPSAREVRVVGDFNDWQGAKHTMEKISDTGEWNLFIPGIEEGVCYKYEVLTAEGQSMLKADPFAFYSELRPNTASVVYSLSGFEWQDEDWLEARKTKSLFNEPVLIYEVHPGSWYKEEGNSFINFRELAHKLVKHIKELGYTHVELLPVAEHPYDRSWGYQATGYFSVTSRYGEPKDFMYFVDYCHQHNIGVILDWVPGHYCNDVHGLKNFDGKPLFEYQYLAKSENPEWGTTNFDLGKSEIQSFLISNAMFWFKEFHIDGLRVDAVASMLYLDYGTIAKQWQPNKYGGRENLEAIDFLKKLNVQVFKEFPDVLMAAEESTSWPLVTAPVHDGGLGFNYKWNMGWMNDMLKYMEMAPFYRKHHHKLITFSFMYAFSENFILPISHDEVVYGKKSLLNKMPGDYWQKFANLRVFLGYMMSHPGKKLLFMGCEFGQFDEWKDFQGLDWDLFDYEMHEKAFTYFKSLSNLYTKENPLWELDNSEKGFAWIDHQDSENSVIVFMRKGKKSQDFLLIVCNFTPAVHDQYRIGVPFSGSYQEVFNSDGESFGGSGVLNSEDIKSEALVCHNQDFSMSVKVPPLAIVMFKLKHHGDIKEGGLKK